MNRVPEFCEQLGVQIGVGVETTAPVALASPVRSVKRPPDSSTRRIQGAWSQTWQHSAKKPSISPRTSSTSGRALWGARAAVEGRRPRDSSSSVSSTAWPRLDVELTASLVARPSSRGHDDSNEPPPRTAHQQRSSAGAVTTASSVFPATCRAMWIRQFGSPQLKKDVPSIGSRIQTRSASRTWPNSSPSSASSGRADESTSCRSLSTARSASRSAIGLQGRRQASPEVGERKPGRSVRHLEREFQIVTTVHSDGRYRVQHRPRGR